ncbi:rab GTPase-binding effector protein 2 [Apteryx mantelli]|uniref:Rab GTPase-binding effector protein 2 n=1 Tax=Apteryx mantelli TaxID=2696672 RepID=A0ABM4G1H4_9AVES
MEGPQESGEPDGSEQDAAPGARDAEGTIQALRVQLAAALAEAETVRAVATVSESTKQEAVAAVRRQCQEEVASLQAILKDSIRSYEAQLAALRQERRPAAPREPPPDSLELQMEKAQEDSRRLRSVVEPMEEEITQLRARLARAEGLIRELRGDPEGRLSPASADEAEEDDGLAFARGCDSLSIAGSVASSSAPAQDDTASLLSTATLVPESIYLPPPGFQLVPDGAWAQLQDEARQQREALRQAGERLEAATRERQGLEEALRRSSEDCAKQVRVLLGQVQDSERLLQNLQATVSQTQRRPRSRWWAELAASHKRLSVEVQRLSEENEGLRGQRGPPSPGDGGDPSEPLPGSVQELQALVRRLWAAGGAQRRAGQHEAERLRIEIVSLRERLQEEQETRAQLQRLLDAQAAAQREDSQLMEASLCSVRSEMERLQQELTQAQQRGQRLEQELGRLRAQREPGEVQHPQGPSPEQPRSLTEGTRGQEA